MGKVITDPFTTQQFYDTLGVTIFLLQQQMGKLTQRGKRLAQDQKASESRPGPWSFQHRPDCCGCLQLHGLHPRAHTLLQKHTCEWGRSTRPKSKGSFLSTVPFPFGLGPFNLALSWARFRTFPKTTPHCLKLIVCKCYNRLQKSLTPSTKKQSVLLVQSYLIDSLAALSFTVDEKEEWVLSSKRYESGGLTTSAEEKNTYYLYLTTTVTCSINMLSRKATITFGFLSVPEEILVGNS